MFFQHVACGNINRAKKLLFGFGLLVLNTWGRHLVKFLGNRKKIYLKRGVFFLTLTIFLSPATSYDTPSHGKSKHITIAIIDTGLDTDHPFIADNLWSNPGETGLDEWGRNKETNGIDDDKNGYIDDVHGWNFVEKNKNIADQNGHGTHVAGVIKQIIYRENPYAPFKILPLKYYVSNSNARTNQEAFLEALEYAIGSGAEVINISGGGYKYNRKEHQLLLSARKKGILVIASAGNKKQSGPFADFFPAAYKLPNVISVVATDPIGNILPTSNVNEFRRNEFAPGQNVFSILPRSQFGFKTGSSQAAATYTGHYVATHVISPR
jgi:subtilisin family serine protease